MLITLTEYLHSNNYIGIEINSWILSLLGLLAKIKWWLRRKASVYNVGDLGSIPGSGSSLAKETATHSSTLA